MHALKNPVVLFGLFMLLFSLYKTLSDDSKYIIRSDGRGYYAYLPALVIFNDPSFDASLNAELDYIGKDQNPKYLVRTEDGDIHNKYFPGVAVLQAPFFVFATAVSWIVGQPIDGYSDIYSFFFYFGSLFYVILGLFLFQKVLRSMFPKARGKISWIIPLLYIATPIFHYSVNTPSFGHLYSFFLFAWFAWITLQLKNSPTRSRFLLLGIALGLIVLVRPTNILIVFALPILLGDLESLKSFFKHIFEKRSRNFICGVLGFISILSLLFLIWKWESGNWIVWSYGGEGFNFTHPEFFSTLFSFRIGLFVHSPVLLIAVIGAIYIYRRNAFQMLFWSVYFLLIAFVISAWWCWDYESPFGNRPFTEHLVFLLIPIIPIIIEKKRWITGMLVLLAIVGGVRLWSFNSGFMQNQRFTSSNYMSSLAIWNSGNADRWNYTRSCKPHGEIIDVNVMLDKPEILTVSSDQEFIYLAEAGLHKPRSNERFYYRVELHKRVSEVPLSDVYLVIDAKNETTGKRYYYSTELFNDRFEGQDEWSELTFEGTINDNLQEYDKVGIYIWNLGHQTFSLRKTRFTLEEYKH
jgi:hypothetical protein